MTVTIGFTGLKGAGKDTAADFLVNEFNFIKHGFADLLKDSVAALFDVTREEIEKWKNDPTVEVRLSVRDPDITGMYSFMHLFSFREFLQRYGTEAHREVFGENFWVEQLKAPDKVSQNLVISDVRFENEAFAIRKRGGYIIKILRDDGKLSDTHVSESGVPDGLIDYTLPNYGHIEELHTRLRSIMEGKIRIGA